MGNLFSNQISKEEKEEKDIADVENGSVKLEDFELLSLIGDGANSSVFLARNKETQKIFAMKIMKKARFISRKEEYLIMEERKILEEHGHSHPFLVTLHFAFQDSEYLYLVQDFVNGGELFFHLQKRKSFKEEEIKLYIAEIVVVLKFLHSNGIIYRDLKPENIVLDSTGHIRLIDFGISKKFSSKKTKRTSTYVGTPSYMAPSVILKKKYGKEIDFWSLGIILYELIFSLPPFYSHSTFRNFERILYSKLTFPSVIKCSEECKDLIRKLLEKNPQKRIRIEEIMQHSWFDSLIDDRIKIDDNGGFKRENLFQEVYQKNIQPRFVPNIENEEDVKYIDQCFLGKIISHQGSNCEEHTNTRRKKKQNQFEGFDYNKEEEEKNEENAEKMKEIQIKFIQFEKAEKRKEKEIDKKIHVYYPFCRI